MVSESILLIVLKKDLKVFLSITFKGLTKSRKKKIRDLLILLPTWSAMEMYHYLDKIRSCRDGYRIYQTA